MIHGGEPARARPPRRSFSAFSPCLEPLSMSRPRPSKSTPSTAEHPNAAPLSVPSNAKSGSPTVKNSSAERSWTVPEELDKRPVDGALKSLAGVPWSEARSAILTGKVRIGGDTVLDLTRYVYTGNVLSLHP